MAKTIFSPFKTICENRPENVERKKLGLLGGFPPENSQLQDIY